ncbi:lytic transglycosylase domain-containing protein [Streptomyces himalayensis]|uniref:Lytic transglycosylase domain-containing protein n=1 Tax=Streptomyces himalayensis subsp. himalayensis TaxID=2756131 RepID=A0A7W0ICT9_9ACTN|nr:lytic transglycosylase domain-containing protein [Streptomyces himalayensis]MBA2951005.1 lytic transglycosylase domain-containing protein [Streptomyces himalayensis subsp. himalayensis]
MAAHFRRRLRKGVATATLAAAAVAALSASQAPGLTDTGTGRQRTDTPAADSDTDPGATDSSYYTDLPPLNSPTASPSPGNGDGNTGDTEAGIPATVLDAYKKAEAALAESKPGCNLPWQLLAAIGKVESGQANGGRVDANGTTTGILGPPLNGNGFAKITDTDGGAYDGDTVHDRAVGPMQFIPSTWESWGSDGNGDGKRDPNNIYDAALAAGRYLCAGDRDLSVTSQLHAAILSYNHSREYLNTVLKWLEYYRKGTHEVPDGTGVLPNNRSDDSDGPSPSPSPSTPGTSKPSTPGTTKPGGGTTSPAPNDPGTGSGSPSPSPTPPTGTDTVARLEDAGTGELTAMAGDAFGERVSVRAESASGVGVPKVRVRFTIVGDTDATFAGGETVATIVTSATGTATAPTIQAGEKAGDFTVRAAVVGRTLSGLDYTATVTERQADTLVRTSDAALTCTPGGEFANDVEVKATYKGAVADGVAATATLITSADDATANDKGPYFKDADGNPVRSLANLETDANGLLKLPKLYADDTTGTFLLRINTAGGATLTVELKVAAATTS